MCERLSSEKAIFGLCQLRDTHSQQTYQNEVDSSNNFTLGLINHSDTLYTLWRLVMEDYI